MKEINPNLIKLAELTHNPELKIDKTILDKKLNTELRNAPNLDGFVYVPSIKLYVAKERTLYGKNWYEAHEELHKQGLQMLTIPEFIKFIKYLRREIRHPRILYNKRKEIEKILDKIFTVNSPWSGGWLDANFKFINEKLHINYNHRIINGKLKPGNSEPLEDCLMEDKTPGIDLEHWLNNSTKQGLPRKDTPDGKLYYRRPMEDNNSVTWFDVNSSWAAVLDCSRSPLYSYLSTGVFACAEGTPRKK